MASKKNKDSTGAKRVRRPRDVVIAEMEAKLARAKARMENAELIGSPPIKALQMARTGLRRFTLKEDSDGNRIDPDGILPPELVKSAAALLEKMDEFALSYGGRVRKEDAA